MFDSFYKLSSSSGHHGQLLSSQLGWMDLATFAGSCQPAQCNITKHACAWRWTLHANDVPWCCAAPGGAAALIIAVMDPMQHLGPDVTASTYLTEFPGSWCIRDLLEPSMRSRFLHGLVLALSTIFGSVLLFVIALFTNNMGPRTKRYPTYWWY